MTHTRLKMFVGETEVQNKQFLILRSVAQASWDWFCHFFGLPLRLVVSHFFGLPLCLVISSFLSLFLFFFVMLVILFHSLRIALALHQHCTSIPSALH